VPGEFIAIGDAAGMVDPFCGEGMRHALETGMLAARVVASGIRSRADYRNMKSEYESVYQWRWAARKALGAMIRRLVWHHRVFASALRATPMWLLNRMWS
jgi:flavin-dependent dehydrogenase